LKPSCVKPVLFTMEAGLVRKRLGSLSARDQAALRASIERLIG